MEALINTGLSFYKGVTYLVENSYNIIEKYSLHAGDVITIQEEESYAILRAIFRHKGNNGYFYPFIVIDWLEKTNQVHSLLECPIYKVQSEKNRDWRLVYSLSVVDQIKKAHFVHRCSSEFLDISLLYDEAKKLQLKAKYENKLEKDSSEHDFLRFLKFYSIAALQVFWFINFTVVYYLYYFCCNYEYNKKVLL
ncbi:hypothetical protein C2G38_2049499 [Gigaspora rosea]|uniref:BAH domain-containing protein n=1 Tax=Gigaspora rosea TaxID=44941 RepID=A0A397U7R3_9GLOM|nr:hypothetical protein C2G38_2049499 [Gigaspora rosea]